MTIDRSRMMKRGTLIGQQLARSDFWHERIFNTLRRYVTWWGGGRRFFDRMHVSRSRGLANVAERRWTSRRTNARMHARGGDQASRRRVHVVSVVTSAGSCVHAPHATRARQLPPLECRITHAARTMLDHSRMRRKNDEFDPLTTRFRAQTIRFSVSSIASRPLGLISSITSPRDRFQFSVLLCEARAIQWNSVIQSETQTVFFFFFPSAAQATVGTLICIVSLSEWAVMFCRSVSLRYLRVLSGKYKEERARNRKSNIISLISCFIYSDSSRRAYAMYINVQIEFVIAWDSSEALKNINIIAKKNLFMNDVASQRYRSQLIYSLLNRRILIVSYSFANDWERSF